MDGIQSFGIPSKCFMGGPGPKMNELLVDYAKRVQSVGFLCVPIAAGTKRPPTWFSWTDLRDGRMTPLTDERIESIFSRSEVARVGILLNNRSLLIDYDGALGKHILWNVMIPRCSNKLQRLLRSTAHTKTPHGGHILVMLDGGAFRSGIEEMVCWQLLSDGPSCNGNDNNNAEIRILSKNKYSIEYGKDYEPVVDIQQVATLSKEESIELVEICRRFKSESSAIRSVGISISPYWVKERRQDLALAIAGYLYKNKVKVDVTRHLIQYLAQIASDEEIEKRLDAVDSTYTKNVNDVSGYTKLMEVIDENESIIRKIEQQFSSKLGYNFKKRNGNGEARTNQSAIAKQKKTEKEKYNERYEYVQKYSNKNLLAESIIIEDKPCFAVVSVEDGRITLEEEIPINDSRNTVLKAPDLVSYINKPYSFTSGSEFEEYIEKARNETLDSLYRKVKAIWAKFIDADDFHISLCAADTVFTYYQDKIGMTHYLFFIGDNDSGKSNNLVVLHFLGYRNMMSVGMSVANVYQFLGSSDEGVGTICEDEADDIDEDHDKMQIAKSGYTKGYPVTKILITPYGRTQHKYNSFCFKAYAAERTPDPVKGKGFLQRIIKLQCSAGLPEYDVLEVTNPAGDDKLQVLLDELYGVRKLLFCHCTLLHHNDKIADIKLNLRNRENQLFKPVLKVFQGTKTFDELLPVLTKFVNDKRSEKYNSYHAYLYKLVGRLLDYDHDQRRQNIIQLKSYNIWSVLKNNLEGSEIPFKPLSYESPDFGTLSQKGVTQTLIDVFGAKKSNRHGDSRMLIFDKTKFDKQRKLYDIKEVRIKQTKPGEPDYDLVGNGDDDGKGTYGTDGTYGTYSGGVNKNSNHSDSTENEETREGSNENYDGKKTESSNYNDGLITDSFKHSYNASHASHMSQMKKSYLDRYPTEVTASMQMQTISSVGSEDDKPTYEFLEPVDAYRCNRCKCVFSSDTKDTDIAHPCNLRGRGHK